MPAGCPAFARQEARLRGVLNGVCEAERARRGLSKRSSVASRAQLEEVARRLPVSAAEVSDINGFGARKAKEHGEAFAAAPRLEEGDRSKAHAALGDERAAAAGMMDGHRTLQHKGAEAGRLALHDQLLPGGKGDDVELAGQLLQLVWLPVVEERAVERAGIEESRGLRLRHFA